MLAITGIDYRLLGRYSFLIYSATILLLITVLIFGKRINGSKSWLGVLPGISIQPSEFAKLGLLILVAWLAARPSIRLNRLNHVFSVCNSKQ